MTILAIKGGGVRGLLSARLGQRIDDELEGWSDRFSLLAGTSTGGIIALGLAAGLSWKTIVNIYTNQIRDIFRDSLWDNLLDLNVLGIPLRGAQYNNDGLYKALEQHFDKLKLKDLKRDVAIPALNLDNRAPAGVRRWDPEIFTRHSHPDEYVVDVAMRTSAAPLMFPTYGGYADGGIFANDPTVLGIGVGVKLGLGKCPTFTLGTGQSPKWIEGEDDEDWGAVTWLRHLVDMLLDSGMNITAELAETVLRERWHCLDPILPREIPADGEAWRGRDALQANLKEISDFADSIDLEETIEWLEKWVVTSD